MSDAPLLAASWIGSSVGAVDMGLFLVAEKGLALSDVITSMPSAELFGAGAAEILVVGYLVAGLVALGNDIAGVME